jgi:hypothetical protein
MLLYVRHFRGGWNRAVCRCMSHEPRGNRPQVEVTGGTWTGATATRHGSGC